MADKKSVSECCASVNLNDVPLEIPSSDTSSTCAASGPHFASSSRQQGESGRHLARGSSTQGRRLPAPFNTSGNNSVLNGSRCASHRCSGACGARARTFGTGGGNKDKAAMASAAGLMKCCVQSTVEQAKQMHVKGADCRRDNPYATLKTETFRKLLERSGRRAKLVNPNNKKKVNWCKPKHDECDGIKLQLCPHLGEGHTHEKLIEEVTGVLLRATQNVNCQLREICRRLLFMKHSVPQMTAPALVNFHAILAEITGMLVADFSSFPSGLRLPDSGAANS